MTQFLKTLPFLAALVAAPAWAAPPDPVAEHHHANAAEAAKPTPKPDTKPGRHACPMMEGKMASAADAPGGKTPSGTMMMGGKGMHCRPAPAAKPAETPHDHDHPEGAPKSPR